MRLWNSRWHMERVDICGVGIGGRVVSLGRVGGDVVGDLWHRFCI